jgi:hypothetical protein
MVAVKMRIARQSSTSITRLPRVVDGTHQHPIKVELVIPSGYLSHMIYITSNQPRT